MREVPDLSRYTSASAGAVLRKFDLALGSIQPQTSAAPKGTIVGQSVRPGTRVRCGTRIDVSVSDGMPAPSCVVPGIESGDVASARQALARRNLALGRVTRRPSDKSPGTVIGQRPAPETTVACGSSVDVLIAVPLPLVRVPPLQGQDVATARRTLEAVGLALGTTEKRESEQPVGGVVDQRPASETEVKPGTAVNVWLSAGVPLVRIPDLRGRDRDSASDILGSLNLRLGEVLDRAVDATPGTIVDQQPRPGTTARRDTPVRVWVAASIEVPSVIGRREADAATILTNQRLRVGTIQTRESSEPAGTVIEQHPQPRRPARLNAPVDLVLAIPVTVVVPDLRGRNRQAATATLGSARLQLGETTTREVDGPPGLIVEQLPPAEARVEPGTAVQVWVGVPRRVQVPDLRGSTRDDSRTLLRARRLVLGSIESRVSVESPGRIVGQQPAAGTRVEIGTPVTIWIAAVAPPDFTPPVTPLLEPPGTGVTVASALPPVPPPDGGAETPPPPTMPEDGPSLLVWLLLGAGVAAALAGITVKARTRTAREPRAVPPSVTLAPHPDPRMSVELSADGPFTGSELWLRPCPDAGIQTIQGSGPLGAIDVTEMR